MARIVVISGPDEGSNFDLDQGRATLGRDPACTVPLSADGVSREHCEILRKGTAFWVRDLGSTNGVLVNGRRISQARLKPNDVLELGQVQLRFMDEATVRVRRAKARTDPFIGKVVGNYRIAKRLGHARFGVRYRGVHLTSGADITVEILRPDLADREEIVKRFIRQVRAGAELKHPNVVQTLGAGNVSKGHYILTEYVKGRSLQSMLDEAGEGGTLDTALTLDILIQVARALEHAAEQNIVHRDIKPASILVTQDGRAKLDNLWLAKHIRGTSTEESLTREGQGAGTLVYTPPEQIDDARNADCRSDIYSLAATIYRCLTGRVPCLGKTVKKTVASIRGEKPQSVRTLNKKVPPSVSLAMDRALEKDPAKRFQTPKELVIELTLARKYQVR